METDVLANSPNTEGQNSEISTFEISNDCPQTDAPISISSPGDSIVSSAQKEGGKKNDDNDLAENDSKSKSVDPSLVSLEKEIEKVDEKVDSTSAQKVNAKEENNNHDAYLDKDLKNHSEPPAADLVSSKSDLEKDNQKLSSTKISTAPTNAIDSNASSIGRKLISLKREIEGKQRTANYFTQRLQQEEQTLNDYKDQEFSDSDIEAQTQNVEQLREKIEGINSEIEKRKKVIAEMEEEWDKVKPVEFESNQMSTPKLLPATMIKKTDSDEDKSVNDVDKYVTKSSSTGSVQREAMRSALSTITSQFSSREKDFDRLRQDEEEIKALLASAMRGIDRDLEINQIEEDQDDEESSLQTEE